MSRDRGLEILLAACRSLLQEARDGLNRRVAADIPQLEALCERLERELRDAPEVPVPDPESV